MSPYRAELCRLVFEYSDGGLWGYWTGVDNVKVTGLWPANEYCADALPLLTGADCTAANNRSATFDGPAPICAGPSVGSLWYVWQADFSGIARLVTSADFNAVVDIFSGSCGNLQPIVCDNRDEHGFTGETTSFEAQAGTEYRIRISGQQEGFGLPTGNLCTKIEQAPGYPEQPANDTCANALQLPVNAPCILADNKNARTAAVLPSLNTLARADVWFHFVADSLPPDDYYEVRSNATFSDIITVYEGGCANLQEVAGNHLGRSLELHDLTVGQTYHVRIGGNFATVEGNLCPELVTKQFAPPANDDCASAIPIPVGGSCVAGSNTGATYSGWRPSCAVSVGHDIWFAFTAPGSGAVRINTGADFRHTLAVWQGDCNNITEIFCALNPLRCDGYVTVGSLTPGQTYYVQVASWLGMAGPQTGAVCIKILDGALPADIQPLQLTVTPLCITGDSAQLNVVATGGTQPYTFLGNMPEEILAVGLPYFTVVQDAAGCEQYQTGVLEDCTVVRCSLVTQAAVKVFLQGPYNSSTQLMHDSLRAKNLIPLTEPYSSMVNFVHTGGGGGEQTSAAVLAVSGPDAIVDWVFLELRDPADLARSVATRSALLQRDGDVVDVDGVSPVTFEAPSGRFYAIAVRHRNHLGAQWGAPLFYPACTAVESDFRTTPTAGFYTFNGLNPVQRQVGGQQMLWAGNGRVDYQVKYNGSANDRTILLSLVGLLTPNTTIPGYRLEDYNMDGLVKYNGSVNDRNVLLSNVGITTPSAILHDQVAR
ncbi:MAG: hypothetical protein IPM98_15370 [Lewinellaceae bacterium]|nr:hypothetical protein [Lewinellaceae bacterium]